MRPHEADGMGIVDHHQGVVALGQIANAGEVGDDAVHREDAVGGDQPAAAIPGLAEPALEVGHVVVGVAQAARLAQPNAVDDAGVVQGVADHRVVFAEDGLEQPGVGVEARQIEDRVVHAEEGGEPGLEVFVHGLRPADEAHRRHAEAPIVERLLGRLDQRRMVRQAEVVVGAEVDHLASARHRDRRRLRRGDDALGLVEAAVAQRLGVVAKRVEKFLVHGAASHIDPARMGRLPPPGKSGRRERAAAPGRRRPFPALDFAGPDIR